MADEPTETRTERIAIAVTPTEKAALEVVRQVYETKYDGVGPVVRDFSLSDAVAFAERVRGVATAGSP